MVIRGAMLSIPLEKQENALLKIGQDFDLQEILDSIQKIYSSSS